MNKPVAFLIGVVGIISGFTGMTMLSPSTATAPSPAQVEEPVGAGSPGAGGDAWIISGTSPKFLKPVSTAYHLQVPSLTNCDTIDTDSQGKFSCGTDATGSGGSYPFTPSTYGSLAVSATTTAILDYAGLISATSTIGKINATSSLTIANLSGLLKATSGLVSAASAGTDYVAPGTTITIAGTAQQITSSAGAQDLSTNRTWTLSFPSHVAFGAGGYESAIGSTTNATSTNITVTGNVIFSGLNCSGNTNGGALTTNSSGVVSCSDDDSSAGGGTFPFTPTTNFGATANSTTTQLFLKVPTSGTVSLSASSTSWFDQINVGSTTASTMATSTFFGGLEVRNQASTSQLTISNSPAALLLTGATGLVGKYGGASACSANNFVTTISAVGGTTCGTAAISGINLGGTLGALTATNGTLTFSGSYDGSTARTVGLNLASQNVWTAASTTFSGGVDMINSTSTNATSTNQYVSGQLRIASLSGLVLTTSGVVSAYAGTAPCTAIQAIVSLNASGVGTCSANFLGTTTDSGIARNMIITTGPTGLLVASSTPTAAAYMATSSTATSTFAGPIMVGTAANSGLLFGTSTLFQGSASQNSFVQSIITNTSNGGTASASFVVNNDKGTNTSYFGEFGINSSGYNNPAYTGEAAGDVFLTTSDSGLVLESATSSAVGYIKFLTGGTLSANTRALFTNIGRFGIASTSPFYGLSIGTTTVLNGTQFAVNIASSSAQAATYTVDWSTGNTQRYILNQATNFVINATSSNPIDGAKYVLKICQDGTGSRTATFVTPGQLIWEGGNGATTTVLATANSVTQIGLMYDARVQRYDILASTTKADPRACVP